MRLAREGEAIDATRGTRSEATLASRVIVSNRHARIGLGDAGGRGTPMDIIDATDRHWSPAAGDFDVRSTWEVRNAIYELLDVHDDDVVVDLTDVDRDRRHRPAGARRRHPPGRPRRPPPDPARLRPGRAPDAAPVPAGPRRRGRAGRRDRLIALRVGQLHTPTRLPAGSRRPTLSMTETVSDRPVKDRPWVMRTYAGHSTADGVQRALPAQPRQGPDRPVGRLRPADPDRLRPRPPARPRRGRQGRRAGPAPRRHAARSSTTSRSTEMNTSMTINATAMWLLALYQVVAEEQGPRLAPDEVAASSPARPRTTSSRSTSPAGRTSSRRSPRCG